MDAEQRQNKLTRIALDLKDLKTTCWAVTDMKKIDKIIKLIDETQLESFDD